MRPVTALLLVSGAVLSGCGDAATVTVTEKITVTETVTVTETAAPEPPTAPVGPAGGPAGGPVDAPSPSTAPLPRLRLEVFTDGCGVIRSDDPPASTYQNLTWVFRDQDGFQVLGRVAEGETRYRYFGGGTFDVVLEAYGDDHYVPVSNEVTVRC